MYFRLELNKKQLPKNLSGYLGNCKDCFKKTLTKLIQKKKDELNGSHEKDTWVEDMERKYSEFVPQSQAKGRKVPIRFNRKNIPASQIRQLATLTDEEIKKRLKQRRINPNTSNGCSESCEVF